MPARWLKKLTQITINLFYTFSGSNFILLLMLCLSFRLYFKYNISPFQSLPPKLPTYPSHSLLNLCPFYVNKCYFIYTQVYIYISICIPKYNLLKTYAVPHSCFQSWPFRHWITYQDALAWGGAPLLLPNLLNCL